MSASALVQRVSSEASRTRSKRDLHEAVLPEEGRGRRHGSFRTTACIQEHFSCTHQCRSAMQTYIELCSERERRLDSFGVQS